MSGCRVSIAEQGKPLWVTQGGLCLWQRLQQVTLWGLFLAAAAAAAEGSLNNRCGWCACGYCTCLGVCTTHSYNQQSATAKVCTPLWGCACGCCRMCAPRKAVAVGAAGHWLRAVLCGYCSRTARRGRVICCSGLVLCPCIGMCNISNRIIWYIFRAAGCICSGVPDGNEHSLKAVLLAAHQCRYRSGSPDTLHAAQQASCAANLLFRPCWCHCSAFAARLPLPGCCELTAALSHF
jgi:hypothetical protein